MTHLGELSDLLLGALVIGPVGFFATSLDNLLILGGLLAAGWKRSAVSYGFMLGNVWVMLAALSTMVFGLFIPAAYLGYLGVVPVLLGIRMLIQTHDDNPETPAPGGLMAVALITFTNSPDSLIVFGPLFIESEWLAVVGLVIGYMGCVLIGLALVRFGMAQGAIAERAQHFAPRLIPWLMILVGGYILWNSTTDLV